MILSRHALYIRGATLLSAMALAVCAALPAKEPAKEKVESPGFVKEMEGSSRDVLEALKSDL